MVGQRSSLAAVSAVLAAALALGACGGAPATPADAPAAASPKPAAAEAAAQGAGRSEGLSTPGNDPKIVAAAKAALQCKWTEEETFDRECAAFNEWADSPDLLGQDEDKAALTLLNLVEDEDVKVRYLALYRFPTRGVLFGDKVLAARLVAQAERESSEHVAGSLGEAVARIDVDKTGLLPRIKKLAESHPSADLRKGVLRRLLASNRASREVFEWVRGALKSEDPKVRYLAVMSINDGQDAFREEACAELVRMLEDPAGEVVGLTAQTFGYGTCPGQIDAFLAYARKRAEAEGVKEWLIANALINLCERDKASEAQKKEVDAIARKLATGKNDDTVRADALRAAVRCDPVRGRQLVLVFKKSGPFRLKQEAERILAEPPPKKK